MLAKNFGSISTKFGVERQYQFRRMFCVMVYRAGAGFEFFCSKWHMPVVCIAFVQWELLTVYLQSHRMAGWEFDRNVSQVDLVGVDFARGYELLFFQAVAVAGPHAADGQQHASAVGQHIGQGGEEVGVHGGGLR